MIDPIKSVASSPSTAADPRGEDRPGQKPATNAPAKVAEGAPPDQPLRLVIEPAAAGAAHGYTYKLFDRTTGALLMELPREGAEKMSRSADYTAGAVFSTRA